MTMDAYIARAQAHRPTREDDFHHAVLELAAQGLKERDIGQALRLDPGAVRRLLNAATAANGDRP